MNACTRPDCPRRGMSVPDAFCGSCGAPLAPVAEPPPPTAYTAVQYGSHHDVQVPFTGAHSYGPATYPSPAAYPPPAGPVQPAPGIGSTVAITVLFGFLGLIPAVANTRRELRCGRPTRRYWHAFWWSLLGTAAVDAALIAVLALAVSGTSTSHDSRTRSLRVNSAAPTTAVTSPSAAATSSPAPSGAAFNDQARVDSALAGARTDVEVTNTYDYRHLPAYRAAALAHTTGALTQTLRSTIDTLITPNGSKHHARQRAKITHVGMSAMTGNGATVLLLGQLTATNDTYPKGRTDPFSAVATVELTGGRWLLSSLTAGGHATCTPPGTADLAAACQAAGFGATAMLTFHLNTFDSDFTRARALLTGTLKTDFDRHRQQTLTAMRAGHFDLRADLVASAVETATPDEVVTLVTLNGYRSTNPNATAAQTLAVTVDNVNGRWLLANVTSIGVS